ncbi:MAG: ATP-binding cassette domain-containing protein, partial [Bacteroidales bacterium]
IALFEEFADLKDVSTSTNPSRPTSVKDSVRIFGICKKINKTLTQKQKLIVLVRLFELVNADKKFTDQRMNIINTVAEVFKVSKEEFEDIECFIKWNEPETLDRSNILIITASDYKCSECKNIRLDSLDHIIFILRIRSVDLYFLKHNANEDILLNGLPVHKERVYLFPPGSSVRLQKGKPIYYSDILSHYLVDSTKTRISFNVERVSYRFPSGSFGIRNISFTEGQGKMIGIMGASGTGKTTMLNILSGIQKPTEGRIRINSIDLYSEDEKLKGVLGYIPQDDLLIEDLTVFQNLYYSAKLCFGDRKNTDIVDLVNKTLKNLGLFDKKDLKVGSPINKVISGGQRKRLNIALELIREPSILFVDEPTSGLSSRDSENVMDLLREMTLKGKLIFAVIHQPSSEIYKMFDTMMILDQGGYMVYYGNPVEAVIYFKTQDAQINREVGECTECGTVNPEVIFNILDAQVVDEFGRYTNKRKVSPDKWEDKFLQGYKMHMIKEETEAPPSNLKIPAKLKQFLIYFFRDTLSKLANTQYLSLTLLEAPILAFILSYIIRYIADPNSSTYIFMENENIPIYIFMSLIVALFLGLILSAEEIFKDRKILRRERFLDLSRSGYLAAKMVILFLISALQALLFVAIGNSILGIKEMYFAYWLAFFTTAAFANILGLNISSSFNSAITIYIVVPLLIIPMMVLSGAMFSFDKLNRRISSVDKVPWIAEIMATKWTYEALMVHQFKDNKFEKFFYDIDKQRSIADFKLQFTLPKLNESLNLVVNDYNDNRLSLEYESKLPLLRNEISKELRLIHDIDFQYFDRLYADEINAEVIQAVRNYFTQLNDYYRQKLNQALDTRERQRRRMMEIDREEYFTLGRNYDNLSLGDIVKKTFEKHQILEYNDELIQHYHPIYLDPNPSSILSFRTHFFAPKKHFLGKLYDTFNFNIMVVWFMTFLLYLALYFDLLKKTVKLIEKVRFNF